MGNEDLAINRAAAKMRELQQQHPDWYALYDDTDVDSCFRSELVDLMHSAPNDFAFGVCYGKYTMRLELEAITGRPFK